MDLNSLYFAVFVLFASTTSVTAGCVIQTHTFNCANGTLVAVPSEIPLDVNTINLDNNNISSIHQEDFASLHYLKRISTNHNSLLHIEDGAFVHQSDLEYLSFGNNRLEFLTHSTFVGLASLKELNLRDNENLIIAHNTLAVTTNLEVFDASGNILIQTYDFSSMVSLRSLSLNRCGIDQLFGPRFRGLLSMENLYVSNNGLTSIPHEALRGMPSLKVLDMSHNLIESIGPKDFRNNPQIEEIYLQLNRIIDIPGKAFANLRNLSVLDLSDNDVFFIHPNAFGDVPRNEILTVILSGNQIHCDCSLQWMYEWTRNAQQVLQGGMCLYPAYVEGRNINSMQREDFQCSPDIDKKGKHEYDIKDGWDVTLVCPVIANPSARTTWNVPKERLGSLEVGDQTGRFKVVTDGSLVISDAVVSDTGLYTCKVTNDVGYLDASVTVVVTKAHRALFTILIIVLIFTLVIGVACCTKPGKMCLQMKFMPSSGYTTLDNVV